MKPARDAHVRAGRRQGSTIVELLMALLILIGLFGAIGLAVNTGTNAYEQGVADASVENQARRMVERIAAEFMDADAAPGMIILAPGLPFGASSINYRRPTGWAAGALTWGPERQIRTVLAAGEVDDGVDNNRNGLVDELQLQLRPDVVGAPGQTVGWGSYVREYLEGEVPNVADDNGNGIDDEGGLCMTFDATTNILTIRLTLERFSPNGGLTTRTVQTSVQVRNDSSL